MKGSCSRVFDLSQALQTRAQSKPWWALLGDKAGRIADDLSADLAMTYSFDAALIYAVETTLRASDSALDAVRDALRDGAGSSVANVEKAAQRLHENAVEFRPLEEQLKHLRNELSDQIRILD